MFLRYPLIPPYIPKVGLFVSFQSTLNNLLSVHVQVYPLFFFSMTRIEYWTIVDISSVNSANFPLDGNAVLRDMQ